MANDLNHCTFIGRLGKDPDVRYTSSGKAVTGFTLAVGSSWKDKDGNKQDSTEWVNCTAFDKLGEICGKYLVKGTQIFIAGRMKTEKYSKDGVDRYTTKIIVHDMQMLGSKPSEASGQPSNQGNKQDSGSGFDDSDDIPF